MPSDLAAEAKSTVSFYREHRATRGYAERIRETTTCDERDVGAVEQLMRDTFGTLDRLDARAFQREAKSAFRAWQSFLRLAGEIE
jgi:hypothetical protein